jgi:hypothetical protein
LAREAHEAFGCSSWSKAFDEFFQGRNVCLGKILQSEDLTITAVGVAILLGANHGRRSPRFHAVGLYQS